MTTETKAKLRALRLRALAEGFRAAAIIGLAWLGCVSFQGCKGTTSVGVEVCREDSSGTVT